MLWWLIAGLAFFTYCLMRAGKDTSIVYTPEQKPDEQRAAELGQGLADLGMTEPRFAVTQEGQRVKAKRTRRQAERVYLASRKLEREA